MMNEVPTLAIETVEFTANDIFKEGHIIKNLLFPIMIKNGIKIDYNRLKEIYVNYSIGKLTQKEFWKTVPKEIEREFLDSMKFDKRMLKNIEFFKKKGYLLGILSNIPKEWGDYLVKKFNLQEYFSIIVFSGEHGTRKPDEKLYEIFMEKTRAKPQNCYFVDDSLINLKEARFLLMKTVWRKNEKQEIRFIPDFVIRNADELKAIMRC